MTRPTWLDPLVGAELRDALVIECRFPTEAVETGDLALDTDRGWFQLHSCHPHRALLAMRGREDVALVGEWTARLGLTLRSTGALVAPFRIGRVDYADDASHLSSHATIGAWLLDDALVARCSLLLDPEDVEIGSPDLLSAYLSHPANRDRPLRLFRGD